MDIADITGNMDAHLEKLQSMRELILANAVMTGEIPAPTGKENHRVRFLRDRFNECGLQNVSVDEVGNGMAILPGKSGRRNILLLAHVDTPFPETEDHTVTVNQDQLSGRAIGNNSLGVATLATLPTILEELGVTFEDNLIFLAHTRSLGHGDLAGFRFFIENNKLPIHAGLCCAGVSLGRISYSSLGMLRGAITCDSPANADWRELGNTGAIANLTRVIDGLLSIPLPQKPRTNIILGSIEGGRGYTTKASHARLGFEIRSEQIGMVSKIEQEIRDIADQVRYETDQAVSLEVLARRTTGGIPYQHPLVKSARDILQHLDITPTITPSTGALAVLIAKGVPALTLGITHGERIAEPSETIFIDPVYRGLAQLIAVLQAIDGGLCDVED